MKSSTGGLTSASVLMPLDSSLLGVEDRLILDSLRSTAGGGVASWEREGTTTLAGSMSLAVGFGRLIVPG